MTLASEDLRDLLHFAREQFKLAAGLNGKDPTGVALLTRSGAKLGGYALSSKNLDAPSAAAEALDVLKPILGDTPREELSQQFEIAAIVIARPFDEGTLAPCEPDEQTLRDLANYIGIGDGQIVYLTTGNTTEILKEFKL